MVTDALLSWLFGLVDWVNTLFPPRDHSFQMTFGWINDMNYFLPISEMFTLMMVFVIMGGPFLLASTVVWVLVGIIRGGATKA